jgi:hypothetical protein
MAYDTMFLVDVVAKYTTHLSLIQQKLLRKYVKIRCSNYFILKMMVTKTTFSQQNLTIVKTGIFPFL